VYDWFSELVNYPTVVARSASDEATFDRPIEAPKIASPFCEGLATTQEAWVV